MDKQFYDKYGKEFHCATCQELTTCVNRLEPLFSNCCAQYLRDRIAELERESESYQKLINDICNKHRVGSLKELDEMYQATTESLYASREYLEELKSAKWELEEQLKNSVKPKFKLKQCVYYIFDGFVGIFKPEYVVEVRDVCVFGIEIYEDGIKYATSYGLFSEEDLFATKEEALAKMEELKGE